MATVLSGSQVAAAYSSALVERVAVLESRGVSPTLAIVRVGAQEADMAYERGALSRCAKVGVSVRQYVLPEETTQEALLRSIEEINQDKGIHGCLILQPLPRHIDAEAVRHALAPAKDMDGITDGSLAGVFSSRKIGYTPCTAQACLELLRHYNYSPAGKHAVVLGRSLVIGKPVAMLLLQENATVTICHSKTPDLAAVCRGANIVIAAVGSAGMVDGSYLSPGQVVVDVGINVDAQGNLAGDVNYAEAAPIVEALTPVPGGVGSVTTTILATHVVEAAERTL